MPNGTYYRRQAEICLSLARGCGQSGTAKRLLALTAEFQAKAGNFKDDAPAAKPAMLSASSRMPASAILPDRQRS
jgi:hypothetical protein